VCSTRSFSLSLPLPKRQPFHERLVQRR
jgi:hypothetical protein